MAYVQTRVGRPDMQGKATSCHIDSDHLNTAIAQRRHQLASLEMAMVAACERAAARGAKRGVRIDDRETWDHPTWRRYLAAASRLEPDYGPGMRNLIREIERLTRVGELLIPA